MVRHHPESVVEMLATMIARPLGARRIPARPGARAGRISIHPLLGWWCRTARPLGPQPRLRRCQRSHQRREARGAARPARPEHRGSARIRHPEDCNRTELTLRRSRPRSLFRNSTWPADINTVEAQPGAGRLRSLIVEARPREDDPAGASGFATTGCPTRLCWPNFGLP
jgi:hypothetical protein